MFTQPLSSIHRQRGVTLMEQIMVLVIVGILTSVAIPSLGKLMKRHQLQVAQADFITALQSARETAVTTGKYTLFCPSIDNASCTEGNRWESGWLLAHDVDHDNQPDDHNPLYVGHAYKANVRISSNGGRRFVHFQPDGSASGTNVTLLFCQYASSEPALSVVVSNSGRIRGAPATPAQAADCAANK
ncbi:GspH/FimT family pseudopilin [Rhodanobacter sp. L36]|uniref:GspH/FimT family pseudopilin n=1 Tax=Rhodanobacter sp. L36 TaxID=1747221 RepID=UPI0020B16AC1|nr:GspH/FimT family pseudopilin [Rhodanobacter sp. L36]